jgi:hypothetical protein
MRRRRREAAGSNDQEIVDPRDLGAAERGGRFSRFRRRQAAPEGAGESQKEGGGCCLWPFMLAVAVATILGARAIGTRRAG